MQETWVQSLDWEDPLKKDMATHPSNLAWRIPGTKEPGRLQSMGLQSQTPLSIHTGLPGWWKLLDLLSLDISFNGITPSGALWRLVSFTQLLLFCHYSAFDFVTLSTAATQPPLSSTPSRSSLVFMSTESGMPSNHLILRHPVLLLPSIFLSIRVFSNESALLIRWPTY